MATSLPLISGDTKWLVLTSLPYAKFSTRQFQWHSKNMKNFFVLDQRDYKWVSLKLLLFILANHSKVLQQENGKITIVDKRYYNPWVSNICHFSIQWFWSSFIWFALESKNISFFYWEEILFWIYYKFIFFLRFGNLLV